MRDDHKQNIEFIFDTITIGIMFLKDKQIVTRGGVLMILFDYDS